MSIIYFNFRKGTDTDCESTTTAPTPEEKLIFLQSQLSQEIEKRLSELQGETLKLQKVSQALAERAETEGVYVPIGDWKTAKFHKLTTEITMLQEILAFVDHATRDQ